MPPFDPIAVVFVILVALLLPYAAIRSSLHLARGAPMPPARSIHIQTLFLLVILAALALWTARRASIDLFPVPAIGALPAAASGAWVAAMLVFAAWRWPRRPEASRRRMAGLLPQSPSGWIMWVAVCLAAGVGEEIVYRGVLHALVERWARSCAAPPEAAWWGAAIFSAAAFGAGHAVQGRAAAAITFAMALVFQGFARWSDSLYLSMASHFMYDLLVGIVYVRLAGRGGLLGPVGPGRSPATPSPAPRAGPPTL